MAAVPIGDALPFHRDRPARPPSAQNKVQRVGQAHVPLRPYVPEDDDEHEDFRREAEMEASYDAGAERLFRSVKDVATPKSKAASARLGGGGHAGAAPSRRR